MSISASDIPVWPRRAPIASCLAVALGVCAITAFGRDGPGGTRPPGRVGAPATSLAMPSYFAAEMPAFTSRDSLGSNRTASTLQVMNCDDSGPGSLRDEIAAAASGATIDLSQLACSTITLGSEIPVPKTTLYIQGPGRELLTIDGASNSRIFKHTGVGTLAIYDVTITNGRYASDIYAKGGCIYSLAHVTVARSTISHCALEGAGKPFGGGIFARAGLTLLYATVSDNDAHATGSYAVGGGAYVKGDLLAKYSTISNNTAHSDFGVVSIGGGVGVLGSHSSLIESSTISGNRATTSAGLDFSAPASVTITNSTVSGNIATDGDGGVAVRNGAPTQQLTVQNSTIAFNTSINGLSGTYSAGLFAADTAVNLYSSIIADNSGPDGANDLAGIGTTTLSGAANLIVSSTLPLPPNIISSSSCPQLDVLTDNGGFTLTHALRSTSPAIDQGSNPTNLTYDQRGAQRASGIQADIGSVERQAGDQMERLMASGFDGLCDE